MMPSALQESSDSTNPTISAIGRKLHELRRERGMSLREAAQRSGLSASFISLVERGETEIAISRLVRLTDAYGTLVADLLADADPVNDSLLRSLDEGRHIVEAGGDVDVVYIPAPDWSAQPFMVTLKPGAHMDDIAHTGQEFLHCLSGNPKVEVNGRAYELRPGDTVFIPRRAQHSYSNPGRGNAVILGAARRAAS
jgi:quercetin dioxygenase-like cupin family protein